MSVNCSINQYYYYTFKMGVRIKRVSVERGSTVLLFLARLTQWLQTSGLHILRKIAGICQRVVEEE